MKFVKLIVLTSLAVLTSCVNDDYIEVPIKQKPLYQYEPWYGDKGDPSDSLLIPIIADTFINVENIQGLATNKDEFRLDAILTIILPLASPSVDYENDTIFKPNFPFFETSFIYDQSNTYYDEFAREPYENDDEMKEYYKSDSIFEISDRYSVKLFHNWDLRKYPFDIQKLRFTARSFIDTSLIRFRQDKIHPSVFSINNDLKTGFEIKEIIFKEEIVDNLVGDGNINSKYSQAVHEIIISRTGSWLFIKLFFGGILALVISWLVFIIPLRDFTSRIELSIGAVFAAVGNKYFVDSAIDSQVLTVADLFNNIIIFMVVLNVGLIIMKRNVVFKNKLINDTKKVSKISIYTAIFLFGLLTIYTIT